MSLNAEPDRPTKGVRLLLGVLGGGLLLVFVLAFLLEPDPRGFGTHEKLGLPPCQFYLLTGCPCPHCGMTTSFSNVVRGRFAAAWQANPLGIPLSLTLLLCVPWCLLSAVTGRWVGTKDPFRWLVFGTIGYLVLAIVTWMSKLVSLWLTK